ncbi:hypothetical protein HPB50_026662 [Hyalomma asiaticum]|uniref:Uncharacterized protein n=1 Tax=Hyalomma asiaticum TaxID=266040 RepID=A0ACB7RT11_HYAAI|nr:hypothetical protein HPB50_026662 [Hyalomma asiaticum]
MADEKVSGYGHLKRDMGLFSAVAVVVGNCVGAGIFITPSIVYQEAGSVGADLLIWVAAGVGSLIHGLCIAELGTVLPSAGGPYEYLKVAVESTGRTGDVLCFLYSWCFLIADPMGATLHALTFTSYLLELVYGSCAPPRSATVLVTFVVIVLRLPAWRKRCPTPCRTIPRALLGGLFLVTGTARLHQYGVLCCPGPGVPDRHRGNGRQLSHEPRGAPQGHILVPIIVCVCTFGTMSASCFTNTRLFMAAARNKHLPEVFSLISVKTSLPVVSIVSRTCIAMAFTVTGSVGFLAKGFMAAVSLMNVMTILAMLRLRRTIMDKSRAIKVPTFLIFVNLAILVTLAVAPLLGRRLLTEYLVTFATLLVGIPAYFVVSALGRTRAGTELFRLVQKVFYCVPCVPYKR